MKAGGTMMFTKGVEILLRISVGSEISFHP